MIVGSIKRGITLIEVMIAITLFAVVASVSASILIQIAKVEKTSSIQNALYEDMRIVLQQITNELQNGAIDYEEYYNAYVLQDPADAHLGINYGVYGSRFYDPGERMDGAATSNPTDLGVECSYYDPSDPTDCEIIYTLSIDYNTGENTSSAPSDNSAFCFDNSPAPCPTEEAVVDHLFLIDNTGTQKTIIGKKSISSEGDYALGIVRMNGEDVDQNGVIDTFYCAGEFNCETSLESLDTDGSVHLPFENTDLDVFYDDTKLVPSISDLGQKFEITSPFNTEFVPISPLRSSIKELAFIIRPIEDPYKAYGEPDFQNHPTVTIILTMDLTEEEKEDYPGDFDPLTIQTTVSAGVLGQITSYPPAFEVKSLGASSWIEAVISEI